MRVTVHTQRRFSKTPSIVKAIRAEEARVAYDMARGTAASARRRVHVITGTLRESITTQKVGVGTHKVIVGAHYGAYEEYGTRHRPPHPYLRPAIEEHKALLARRMKRVIHR